MSCVASMSSSCVGFWSLWSGCTRADFLDTACVGDFSTDSERLRFSFLGVADLLLRGLGGFLVEAGTRLSFV